MPERPLARHVPSRPARKCARASSVKRPPLRARWGPKLADWPSRAWPHGSVQRIGFPPVTAIVAPDT